MRPGSTRSISSATAASSRSACFSSVLTVTTASAARCQRSWCSTSDTATLNFFRRSLIRRNTIRFSFNDWLPGTCSSTVKRAITMSLQGRKAEGQKGRSSRMEGRMDGMPKAEGQEGRRAKVGRLKGAAFPPSPFHLPALPPSAFPPSSPSCREFLPFCLPAFLPSCLPVLPLCSYGYALHREHLDHVADLQVVVLVEADAALEAGLHLAHVVLEAAQRADLSLVDHDVVAQQARLRVAGARDAPFGDHAAGDRAELRHLERLAHVRDADQIGRAHV